MLTLMQLRARLRAILTDTTTWTNSSLDGLLQDAIRMYSAEYPRRLHHTLTLVTGTQEYTLPGGTDLMGILSVEYPSGQDPAEFLTQVEYRDTRFATGDDVYALIGPVDTAAANADTVGLRIAFAEDVATGEYAEIEYATTHRIFTASDEDATITVPEEHAHALLLGANYLALVGLETNATWQECISNDKLTQISVAVSDAWARWRTAMESLHGPAPTSSVVSWTNVGMC